MLRPSVIDDHLPSLAGLSAKLNGGDALNYTATFGLFAALGSADGSLEEIAHQAIGPLTKIGGSWSCTKSSLLEEEVASSLEYLGDNGAHPNRDFLNSPMFQEVVDCATREIGDFIDAADLLIDFYLAEGHPFYPVFWDFAFAIVRGRDAYILIGSSSD
ncbi:MAG: hypothetical protein ACI9K5_003831 [Gammaproteobacteria bacterium]|jgi:hypothetical protein